MIYPRSALMKTSKLLLSLIILFCSFSNQAPKISDLSQIPEEAQKKIEEFLSFLILNEGFAYVLFGSKPMSTIVHDKTTPTFYKKLYTSQLFELESWWKTWEKYKHLFPMKHYLFFTQSRGNWFEIFLINKSSCLKTIEENLTFFQEVIGGKFSDKEIFDHVISCDHVVSIGLNNSQALLGLLLGYGKENSICFEKFFSKEKKIFFPSPQNSADLMPLESNPLIIPCFTSFSKQETIKILKRYKKERDKIINIYSQGDFLEITLQKLMS